MNVAARAVFLRNQSGFHPVVPFKQGKHKMIAFDFTENNKELNDDIIEDTDAFAAWIAEKLKRSDATYGVGGYAEHRTVYSRSGVFNADSPEGEPRRLHLGVDIWGNAGTPVTAPLGGMIHSFAFNNHYGDYGATIILLHQLEGFAFYTLYGHLSLKDIEHLSEGQYIIRGQTVGHFGTPHENGHWPPHLHFQVIIDLGVYKGDYPGVCKFSEREKYLHNCPDPDLILQINRYIEK
jgi:murein DD-endopeptidase MepM/ murein hydrolase activator NlpD